MLLQMECSWYLLLLGSNTAFKPGFAVSINRRNWFGSYCWPHYHSALRCLHKKFLKDLLCFKLEDIVVPFYTRLQTFTVRVKIYSVFFNSHHEQSHSCLHDLLNEAMSINKMAERVDQHLVDSGRQKGYSRPSSFYLLFFFL